MRRVPRWDLGQVIWQGGENFMINFEQISYLGRQ